ncbi:hypothetical protein UA08_07402 [Talaromyces atroroseus]|uniref:Cytochrome P450 n=1 Tax=Talaromyces atroroseus TaxID=1441469 RepID=A0A225A959_TALAT|nr:hypothetical protein UA08_07402 [Talaromyces atroroseus]OKL57242.1 hypothetical protein UA08_07402 [Talaromyces atroroseus]
MLLETEFLKAQAPGAVFVSTLALLGLFVLREALFQPIQDHGYPSPVVRVSPYELDISDIDAVKEIHRVGGHYRKADFYNNIGHRSIKTLFSTTDPHYHAIRRRLLSAGMAHTNLSTVEPLVYDRLQLTMNQMASEMRRRGVVDVFKWWTFMATDVIGELSFGQSFQTLEHGEKTQYVRDLENVSSFMAVRVTFPKLVEYSSFFPIPILRRVQQAGGRMAQYAQRAIKNYQSMIDKNPENPKQTLFTKMFNSGPDGLTLAEITPEAGGYIVAGSDTTAITLTYLVWAVCRNPAIRDKLVAEVNTLPSDFNKDHIRDLPFLNQVIHEALRLHSAVPSALPRAVPKEGATLAGYNIPGGITVSTQAYTLHRNADVFPEPQSFDPSRWEEPTKEMKHVFMPFGGGSRNNSSVTGVVFWSLIEEDEE